MKMKQHLIEIKPLMIQSLLIDMCVKDHQGCTMQNFVNVHIRLQVSKEMKIILISALAIIVLLSAIAQAQIYTKLVAIISLILVTESRLEFDPLIVCLFIFITI